MTGDGGRAGDDERLGVLFHAAVGDPPPPSFDHRDVVGASRRATARRRSALAGGVLAVLAIAGVGVTAALPGSSDGSATSASAPVPDAARQGESSPGGAEDGAAGGIELPEALRDAPPYTGAPLGPGDPAGCADRQDPALRALVEEVLPEVAGAPEAPTTLECRPGGERGVNLEVSDAGAAGLLTVEYLPPGEEPPVIDPQASASAPTASGGTVVVLARALDPADRAPFEARLDTVATYLAPRL
jgi:hypothetical protein